jgi:hypothetical protein
MEGFFRYCGKIRGVLFLQDIVKGEEITRGCLLPSNENSVLIPTRWGDASYGWSWQHGSHDPIVGRIPVLTHFGTLLSLLQLKNRYSRSLPV